MKKHGKAPSERSDEVTPKRALPTELLKSSSSRSLLSDSSVGSRSSPHRAPQTRGSGKENVLVPMAEPRSRAEIGKSKKPVEDINRVGVQTKSSKVKGQPIEMTKPVKSATAKSVVAETKGEELSQEDESEAGIKPSTKDLTKLYKDKSQSLKKRSAAGEAAGKMVGGKGLLTPEPVQVKNKSSGVKEAPKAKGPPKVTVVKSKPSDVETKAPKVNSKPVRVQSKPPEGKAKSAKRTSERDSESPRKEDLKGSEKPGLVKKLDQSDQRQIPALLPEGGKRTTKAKPEGKGPIVVAEAGRATGGEKSKLAASWDKPFELEPEPKTSPSGTLSAVSSFIQDMELESAANLVKTVASIQLFSRLEDSGSSLSSPQRRPTMERFTKQRPVSSASSKSQEESSTAQPGRRTAVTISVRPEPGSSDEEEPDSEQRERGSSGQKEGEESRDETEEEGETTEGEEDESQEGTDSRGRAQGSVRSGAQTRSDTGESGTR